jgi:selenocysteine-specific elongation factor
VRLHIGTIEVLARVQVLNDANEIAAGERDFVQLRLESPVVAVPEERFILRSYSPQITIAGGRVLDNAAAKHRRKDIENVRKGLSNLIAADKTTRVKIYLETSDELGATFADLQARTGWRREILQKAITENVEKKAIVKAEDFLIARTPFENLKAKTLSEIENFHRREPLSKGVLRETLREKIFAHLPLEIFKTVLLSLEKENKIVAEKDTIRAAAHNLELSADEKILRERFEKIYKQSKLEVPKLEDALFEAASGTKSNREHARKVFQLLLNSGEIVKITEEFYFSKDAVRELTEKIKAFADASADRLIDVAAFKTIADVSRKYAIPLLEYFDRERITRRTGDKRLIL